MRTSFSIKGKSSKRKKKEQKKERDRDWRRWTERKENLQAFFAMHNNRRQPGYDDKGNEGSERTANTAIGAVEKDTSGRKASGFTV